MSIFLSLLYRSSVLPPPPALLWTLTKTVTNVGPTQLQLILCRSEQPAILGLCPITSKRLALSLQVDLLV